MLTQKYKQQQQQVRVLTNESNYVKGMYFSDMPLAEGYSRVLINFDIDSLSGKLKPRKGLQSLGIIKPEGKATQYLNRNSGFNIITDSKVCAASDPTDPRKINRYLQAIMYNTETRTLLTTTCNPEVLDNSLFKVSSFTSGSNNNFIAPAPYVIPNPGVHGKKCIHNNFFKHPAGTFAFENSFYTFLRENKHYGCLITELPNKDYINFEGEIISDYNDLKNNSMYSKGEPGEYFKFSNGASKGLIAYYNNAGNLEIWQDTEDVLVTTLFDDIAPEYPLCYTKLGAEILNAGDILLDKSILKKDIDPNKYYVCVLTPQRLNPTEASSWGYNMLLKDPYQFECETTAINLVTILGILPYDKAGKIVLTPRKNQEVTLKAYYRAPEKFYSDTQNPRFYATTKKRINVTKEIERLKEYDGTYRLKNDPDTIVYYGYVIIASVTYKAYYYKDANGNVQLLQNTNSLEKETEYETSAQDPENKEALDSAVTDLDKFKFGDWWYCTEDKEYYMVMPGRTLNEKELRLFGTTQPAASVSLGLNYDRTNDKDAKENPIRVKWEMRSSGAATWTELSNEVFTLSDYYRTHGNHAPFTYTGTMPSDEVLIKLTITDVTDIVNDEEYVLSTNTIGLSLVSDDLANTLNLDAKNYDLGRCTGMCEWEQRLVLWGVPGALNTLFVSDVNNPTYFPYPNNIDIFPDPIIAVHNYGNELLVLTTSALYRLVWDTEGTGWSHKLVQQNLHVTEEDTYMSCVIKNMFFFKSGEYFYMMVPKSTTASSVRGEVAIAPISKIIEDLLDNFHKEVYNIVKVMVDKPTLEDFTEKLVNYFSYVDNARVVVNYVYALDNTTAATTVQDTENSKYLYVQLIYDTEARTWSMRIFEAAHMLYASHADAIQQDRFIDITPALDNNQLTLQYYKFTDLTDKTLQYIDNTGTAKEAVKIIKNYQYIDTGNREINTELKKRFREFQFKIKNNTATNLGFYTSFLIDGSLRKDLQRYEPRFILDPVSNEGTIVVERTLDVNTLTYHTTRIERVIVPTKMLQDNGVLTPTILNDSSDPDHWVLDQSAFPGRTFWKIRMPITGKGFTPRVIMLATNEADYEILGHSWAYRTMNAR